MKLIFSQARKRRQELIDKIQLSAIAFVAFVPFILIAIQAWHNFVTL